MWKAISKLLLVLIFFSSCLYAEVPIIDIMVVYTPKALKEFNNDEEAIKSKINKCIDFTNKAFKNSLINAEVTLVHCQQVFYVEHSNPALNVLRLAKTNDGFMDIVHDLRNEHGADIVTLFTGYNKTSCGNAYLLWDVKMLPEVMSKYGFNTMIARCNPSTFAHELGHNLGCQHDIETSGVIGGLFDYSYGSRFKGDSGRTHRTIMAYPPGISIPYFSNPNMLFDGKPTGVKGKADNARTINNSASFVSMYRQRKELKITSDLVYSTIKVGKLVNFCIFASTAPNKTITYVWNFGDGTTKVGNNCEIYTYTKPGKYLVSVTVSDGDKTINVSTEITVQKVEAKPLKVRKLSGYIRTNNDSCLVSGRFDEVVSGTDVEININGAHGAFILNEKGKSTQDDNKIAVRGRRFKCRLSGEWSKDWLSIFENNKNTFVVRIDIDGTSYLGTAPVRLITKKNLIYKVKKY